MSRSPPSSSPCDSLFQQTQVKILTINSFKVQTPPTSYILIRPNCQCEQNRQIKFRFDGLDAIFEGGKAIFILQNIAIYRGIKGRVRFHKEFGAQSLKKDVNISYMNKGKNNYRKTIFWQRFPSDYCVYFEKQNNRFSLNFSTVVLPPRRLPLLGPTSLCFVSKGSYHQDL